MNNAKNFQIGKRYEYKVIDFLVRRGVKLSEIEDNYSNTSNFTDDYDIDISHLNLKVEVKGSNTKSFKFWKSSYSKEVNIYAFYFKERDLTLFLTKREFLDVIGRKSLRGNHTKISHLKLMDVYDKALNLREVYNF